MSVIFFESKTQIETAVAGVYAELDNIIQIKHYGISPTKTNEINPDNIPEIPYIMITSAGNTNIVEGRKIIVQFRTGLTATLLSSATYQNLFVGEIAYLDKNINWAIGEVTFKVRNNLALLTQDFFGSETHYGSIVQLTDYDPDKYIFRIPDSINDVYQIFSNDTEISSNNWAYDYLIKTINFFRSYSSSSVIKLSGHTDQQLKTIAELLLTNVDYNTVTDSATPLKHLFFKSTLSIFRALRMLGFIYNYRLFAGKDGYINFVPLKISTDTSFGSFSDTDGIVSEIKRKLEFSGVTKCIANGMTMTIKQHNRHNNLLDDFNDNGIGNSFGGEWEVYTNSDLNTISPEVGNFSAQYERGNYGAKLYANIITGYAKLFCTLNKSGIGQDLSSYTGIRISYRSTCPLYIYLDNAYYKLSNTGAINTVEIPFSSFMGSKTLSAIVNIAFIMKSAGRHEFFVDFVEFYPAGVTTETFYESTTQLTETVGISSGGYITITFPFCQETELLQDVATSIKEFYDGGVYQYEVTCICPTTIPEIGDIILLTSSEHSIVNEPVEVIAFDFGINGASFSITYLLQTSYLESQLTDRRRVDIQAEGGGSDTFTVDSVSGTSNAVDVVYNHEAEELSAESIFNYRVIPPDLSINSAGGIGTSIEVLFNTKLDTIDKDFFNAQRFAEFGIESITGTDTSIIVNFTHEINIYDKTFFNAVLIAIFGIESITATGTSIDIIFTHKLSNIDKNMFKIIKII